MPATPLRRLALPIAIVLAAAGCSDSADSTTTSSPPPPTSTTTTSVADTTTTSLAETTTTQPSTTTTIPLSGPDLYHSPSREVIRLGTGFIEAWSPDGSHIVVSEESDEFSEPGCEGFPEPVLFTLPVTGGEKVLAVVDDGDPALLNGRLYRGQGTQVIMIVGCEGFTTGAYFGEMDPDGGIGDFAQVELGDAGLREGVISPHPGLDGRLLFVNASFFDAEAVGDVVALARDGTVETVLGGRRAMGVAQASDGALVIIEDADLVVVEPDARDRFRVPVGDAFAIQLSPDRGMAAVWGFSDVPLTVVDLATGGIVLTLEPEQGGGLHSPAWAPAGDGIAYLEQTALGDELLTVATLDGRTTPLITPGIVFRPLWRPDGRAIAYNLVTDDVATVDVMLIELG